MISSLIGGALVALALMAIAVMRSGAAREPKPLWARGETVESLCAVLLVCMIALGFSLVVYSTRGGWIPPLLGLAVALVGSIVALLMAPRRRAAERRQARAGAS